MSDRMEKMLWILGGIIVIVLLLAGLFRWWCVDFVDNYQLGYKFDRRSGEITRLEQSGYVVTPPILVQVHTLDLRPNQVCMNANTRVLNCKLVQFDTKGFDTFIQWHGRGAGEKDIYEILKSYAFNVNEGRDCPFLTILDDMRRKSGTTAVNVPQDQ